MIKKIIAIYLFIGVLCSPLIYSNCALSYIPISNASKYGMAFGSSFYWPSYIFSIEPEVNGESIESFEKSVIDIVLYRQDKLYSDNRYASTMLFNAIGYCLVDSGLKQSNDFYSLFKDIFKNNINASKDLEKIRDKVINMFDGSDYADIVELGDSCRQRLI